VPSSNPPPSLAVMQPHVPKKSHKSKAEQARIAAKKAAKAAEIEAKLKEEEERKKSLVDQPVIHSVETEKEAKGRKGAGGVKSVSNSNKGSLNEEKAKK
jgi:hypothetical protein